MSAQSRKIFGIFGLLLGLFVYIVVAATVATTWLPQHWAAQIVFYAVAGVAWALPLKPYMAWMIKVDEE